MTKRTMNAIHQPQEDAPSKVCTKCGQDLPLAEYGRDRRLRDGRQSACRECARAASRAWKARHPERARATSAAWRRANPARKAKSAAEWYAANREHSLANNRSWRNANGARKKSLAAAWYLANREEQRARIAAWHAAHPAAARERAARRRARMRGAAVVERIYRAKVWERDRGRCHICGQMADPKEWHLEHIVPLSRGGEHSYRNVAVAHPACNQRKYANVPARLRLEG